MFRSTKVVFCLREDVQHKPLSGILQNLRKVVDLGEAWLGFGVFAILQYTDLEYFATYPELTDTSGYFCVRLLL